MLLLQIEKAQYLGGHQFTLTFNDGREGMADIRPLLECSPRRIFAPLAEEPFVQRFELKHGTLCWPGEIDVASEYFYFLCFRDDPELQKKFVEWGYLSETKREAA